MQRGTLTGCITVALLVATLCSVASGVAAVLPVVRCPTQFGIAGAAPAAPRTLIVRSSAPLGGLVAYTNTELFLLGPRRLRCAGVVAADGGSQIVAWPHGAVRPRMHSHGAGLSLSRNPACAGCKAADSCPFFAAFARGLGFSCDSLVPTAERVSRPRPGLALFEDPPGVSGSGWPSGGADPANGLVKIGRSREAPVYRATCTLPAAARSLCTTILNDVLYRYR